ncbi:zinc finger protein 585A-like isoform X2 [Ochlerotatus camptorhynchus]
MVISCAVKTCRNHNKNCDLSFYTFPLPRKYSTKEHEKLLAMRLAMWRKASGYTKPVNRSVRICGKHFVGGKPTNFDEPANVDWVPSLHLPEQPPSAVQGAEVEAAGEISRPEQEKHPQTICSMKYCRSNDRPSWKTKIFPFPMLDTTNYVRRVLSEKRLLIWLQLLDQSTSWDKVDICKLQLCSLHFATGTMAELTDVENVDWIPTVNMTKRVCFADHVAHFDLYNLISLVNDSRMTQNCMTIDDFSLPQASAAENAKLAEKAAEPVTFPGRPKVFVGLKCILCLATAMLKPLKPEHRQAIEILFKDKLRVESELICANCSKSVCDFFTFYKTILNNQEKATVRKLKNVFPVPQNFQKRLAPAPLTSAPVEKKMRSADEKGVKLFELLTTNEFQCKLCKITLATRSVLNDHLFLAHKVKISCKLCKKSFSPEGYTKHKAECLAKIKARRQANKVATDGAVPSNANVTTPKQVTPPPSNKKHSCYICKEFYTPGEMIAHVKTHGIDTGIKQDVMKDYEICRLCQKAIQKKNMERHMEAHESQRNQLKKLIQEQQEKQRFQCSECLLEFRTIAQMEKHKTKHKLVNQDDRIECPDCGRVMTAKYFKFHVQLVHDNDLLPCEKCGKQFSRAALKKHRSTTCGDDGMVTCEHCGKTMREYLLKGHVSKVHSTTTVKCSFCSKEFDSKEYASSHERWSHREEWDKRKREGVKRLDLDREQLEEALGIKTNPNEDEDSSTCPVCFNFHGTKSGVEQHVKKAHYTEYMSMVMGGIIVSSGEDALEDFNPEEYISEVLQPDEDIDAM